MRPGLRRAGIACAVLFALTTLLFLIRPDSDTLLSRLRQHADTAGMSLQTSGASLSLMNGLSLRLNDLTLQGHGMHIHARAAFISGSWRALLTGDFVPDSVFLNTADITLDSLVAPSALLPNLPPLSRLHVSKANFALADNGLKLDDVQLDVRDLKPDHDMRWELLARIGNEPITSHGQAHLRGNHFATAFAKLKMERVPLAELALPPALPTLAFKRVSSTLTLDLAADGAWHVFGELRLLPTGKRGEPLILRSKLQGNADAWLAWRDTYIHFGGQNVLKSSGTCQTADHCRGRFSGSDLALPSILRLLDSRSLAKSRGNIDLRGELQWQKRTLSGQLQGAWRKLRYGPAQIVLPPARWRLAKLRYHPESGLQLSDMQIEPSGKTGSIDLARFSHDADGSRYTLRLNDSTTLWQPLLNIALHREGIAAAVKGKGAMTGEIAGDHSATQSRIDFEIDAGDAAIAYDDLFTKPARVTADLHGHWQRQNDTGATAITLRQSSLAGSRVEALVWHGGRANSQRLDVKDAHLDFSAMKNAGIRLPSPLSGLAGNIRGDLAGRWQKREGRIEPVWSSLHGRLRLHGLLWQGNHWDGVIGLVQGMARPGPLQWRREAGHALLHGQVDMTTGRGNVDIDEASLDAEALPLLFTTPINLHGRIRGTRFHLNDNTTIQNLHGRYRLTPDSLMLTRLAGKLAGGEARTDKLTLKHVGKTLWLETRLHLVRVQLSRLEQWPAWLQARPFGRCFANLYLKGPLATGRWPEWRGDGDLALFSGGWIPLAKAGMTGDQAMPGEPKHFRRLELRFKLTPEGALFPKLRIQRGTQQLQGSGHMTHNGHIKLRLSGKQATERRIEDDWPEIDLPLDQTTGHRGEESR